MLVLLSQIACLLHVCCYFHGWAQSLLKIPTKHWKLATTTKWINPMKMDFLPFLNVLKDNFLSICEVYWSKQAFCFGLLVSLKLWVSFMDCSRWLYIWFTMKTHIIFIFCIPMFHGLFLELMKHFLEVCYGWLCDMLSTFSFLCWCWDTVKVVVSIQGDISW